MHRSAFAILAAVIAVGAAATCTTDPGNQYGTGGTTGTIQVRDSLIGTKKVGEVPDTSGFTVTVGPTQKAVAQGGVVSFGGLQPGDYAVTLGGTLDNCTIAGGASQSTQVFPGYVQYLVFVTTCS